MKKRLSRSYRKKLYQQSLGFTLFFFTIVSFQKRILTWLFETQLSFSISTIASLVTSDNFLNEFMQKGIHGGIVVGIFLSIEIIFFITCILLLLIKLWRLHHSRYWKKTDYLLVSGYFILLVGSLYFSWVIFSQTYQTVTTIQYRVNKLSPSQLKSLSDQWQYFIINYRFSLTSIFRDISLLTSELNQMIRSIKEIAGIPDLINRWLTKMNQVKLHYFVFISFSTFILLIAQLKEYKLWFKGVSKNNSLSQDDLLTIIKEQQQLLDKVTTVTPENVPPRKIATQSKQKNRK